MRMIKTFKILDFLFLDTSNGAYQFEWSWSSLYVL